MNQCIAMVRIYISQLFPTYVRCSKRARPGFKTCWHHRKEKP